MDDFVRRSDALEIALKLTQGYWKESYVRKCVEQIPSADAVERKCGEWIPCTKYGLVMTEMMYREGKKWYGYKCSQCNFIYKGNALTQSPYCQCCGADMRGEDND